MNKKFVIGNWKSNKTIDEIYEWFKQFSEKFSSASALFAEKMIFIICPSFVHMSLVKQLIDTYQLPIHLAAQDVSAFDNGAYTGAVSARQIAEYAQYVLIGHSERRKYFHEDDHILKQKVKQAQAQNLSVIYCVPDTQASVPSTVEIVAYEPIWAIGTGKTDTPDNANKTALIIKTNTKSHYVIYGGSVNPENVKQFLDKDAINGVLPGGASLDALKFWEMIVNAAS